ncbi:TPA: hypothetical protein JIP90_003517 [Acinetobacter baumannii]|uniref:hypothetical protein n=1 Tax=Acinetobacter baumannii TaxID=470 RepID=UPI0020235D9E|nr:hypothetical protein [Acinetobacter baumannii]MCL8260991.1 hypothetical protein [Acinetobacter baumannii]HAV4196738.1 hypothetical protein [Acinetobacter baumannii]
MHFDKLSSPIQALNLYKQAQLLKLKTLRLNRHNDSYKYSEFIIDNFPNHPISFSDFPPSGSPSDPHCFDQFCYLINFPTLVNGFEKYLDLRFSCLLNQGWYQRIKYFFKGPLDLIEFLKFIPASTQLILLPIYNRLQNINFVRVNFPALEYEVSEFKVVYDYSTNGKFSAFGLKRRWYQIGENLNIYPSEQYLVIPMRQFLAAVFHQLNMRFFARNNDDPDALTLIVQHHAALCEFEGREVDVLVYHDEFLDIYMYENKLRLTKDLIYKNPLN